MLSAAGANLAQIRAGTRCAFPVCGGTHHGPKQNSGGSGWASGSNQTSHQNPLEGELDHHTENAHPTVSTDQQMMTPLRLWKHRNLQPTSKLDPPVEISNPSQTAAGCDHCTGRQCLCYRLHLCILPFCQAAVRRAECLAAQDLRCGRSGSSLLRSLW